MDQVRLKKGRDKAARNRHPWVFSGAIERVIGSPEDGDVVAIHDQRGRFIAYGTLNRQSQIAARLLSWREDETIDRAFWQRRIKEAIARRSVLASDPDTTAYRLIHAESDLLPGLIVDRYGEWLVVQLLTLGVEQQKAIIVDALREALKPRGVYERSDVEVRAVREQHDLHWEEVMSFIREQEDIESPVESAVERCLEVMPRLWARPR